MLGGVLSELPKFFLESAPSGLAVDLNYAKDYLRIDQTFTDHDTYIQNLIIAATQEAEAFTRRKLLRQQWSLYWDGFPPTRRMEMPLVPFVTLDLFEYQDQATGNWTTMDPTIYTTDDKSLVPALVLQSLVPMWPLTKYLQVNSVHAKVTCGYADGTKVPEVIRMAILRMVSTWYDNTADVVQGVSVTEVPISASRLMMPYKIFTF